MSNRMIFQGLKRYPVTELIIHCSATRRAWMHNSTALQKLGEIRLWHVRDNGWRREGYHYLIDLDGTTVAGRPETEIGAHVIGRNNGTIGVCLVGGFGSNEKDLFSKNYTREQELALIKLINDIRSRTEIKRISGHNEHAAKACPGFDVPTWLKSVKSACR